MKDRIEELLARLREIKGLLGPPGTPVDEGVINRIRRIVAGK